MAEVNLEFLARQQERMLEEQARMRDDLTVLLAIVQRMDATMGGFINELRALHAKQDQLVETP